MPRLPGPRGPRALGRAVVQARPRHRDAAPPHRDPDQHRRAHLRPGLRRAHLAGLPHRRGGGVPGHRAGQPPDADLQRERPGRRRGAASGAVGRPDARRARVGALGAGLRGPPRRRRRPPRCPRGRWPASSTRCGGSGASWRPSSATTGSTSCASPTGASRGRRTAGHRVTTSTTCSTGPRWPPATSCAGSSSCIDLAGQVADAAGDVPLRRTARQTVALLRRGVVAYSSLD